MPFLVPQNLETFFKFCTCLFWSLCQISRLCTWTLNLFHVSILMSILNCIIFGLHGKRFQKFQKKLFFCLVCSIILVSQFLRLSYWLGLLNWSAGQLEYFWVFCSILWILFQEWSCYAFLIRSLHWWFLRPDFLELTFSLTSTALQLKFLFVTSFLV